jgi:hypothetical protein
MPIKIPTRKDHVLFDPIVGHYPIGRRHELLKGYQNGLSATTAYFFSLQTSSAVKPKRDPLRLSMATAFHMQGIIRREPTAKRAATADLLSRAKQAHALCNFCFCAMANSTATLDSRSGWDKAKDVREIRAYRESKDYFDWRPGSNYRAYSGAISDLWDARYINSIRTNATRDSGKREISALYAGSNWYCHVCGINNDGPLDDSTCHYRSSKRASNDLRGLLHYATPHMTTHLLRLTGAFIPPRVTNLTMQSVGSSCRRSKALNGVYHPTRPDEVPPASVTP